MRAHVVLDTSSCGNVITAKLANSLRAKKTFSPLDLDSIVGEQPSTHTIEITLSAVYPKLSTMKHMTVCQILSRIPEADT